MSGYEYKGFYGKWSWDYDYIIYMAPEYKKYMRYDMGKIEEALDELQVEVYQADGTLKTTTDDITEYINDRGIKIDNIDEEDKGVVNLMTTQEAMVRKVRREREVTPIDSIEPAYEGRAAKRSAYRLNPLRTEGLEHKISRSTNPPLPTVPLLAPPKAALDRGSVLKLDNNFIYNIMGPDIMDDHSIIKGQGFIEDETFIKLFMYKFILGKVFNSSKVTNHDKCRITFNKKTGRLYILYTQKNDINNKHSKYKLRIMQVSTQLNFLQSNLDKFEENLVAMFLQKLMEVVKEKLGSSPTIYSEKEKRYNYSKTIPIQIYARNVLGLVWQYKANASLPWLTEEFFDAIEQMRSSLYATSNSKYKGMKRRNFTKNLKLKPHPTTIMKYIFGPLYNKTIYKMAMGYKSHDAYIWDLADLVQKDKIFHHFLARLLSKPCGMDKFNTLSMSIIGFMWDLKQDGGSDSLNLFHKYLKMLNLFMDKGDDYGLPSWHTFRDTFEMAKRYHISINMKSIQNGRDLVELHDRFSAYATRDAKALALTSLNGSVFLSFDHPTKEYDGFTFKFLGSVNDLVHEGEMMKHCVGGYGHYCFSGNSLIFSMRKGEVGYITIELSGSDRGFHIKQQYTRHDIQVTNPRILEIVEEWRQDLIKLHRNDVHTYEESCDIVQEFIKQIRLLDKGELSPESLTAALCKRDELLPKVKQLNLFDYVETILYELGINPSRYIDSSQPEESEYTPLQSDVPYLMEKIAELSDMVLAEEDVSYGAA